MSLFRLDYQYFHSYRHPKFSKTIIRGALKKNVTKSGKRSKEGGRPYFPFFPTVNADFKRFSSTKNKLILKYILGNFKCVKLMFFF